MQTCIFCQINSTFQNQQAQLEQQPDTQQSSPVAAVHDETSQIAPTTVVAESVVAQDATVARSSRSASPTPSLASNASG